ncbi:MAG: TrmH family RNA methyltransferase, partial [Armatimonadaceae bacterium]
NIPAARHCDLIQLTGHRQAAPDVRFSLIYGPEADDLRHEHLDLCRWVVRIPTHSAYPSFNLAQSVLVTLYELTRGADNLAQQPTTMDDRGAVLPSAGDLDQLDRILSDVMSLSGFTRAGMPPAAARRIHALLRRADLDQSELAALMAMFGKIRTSLARAVNDESKG